MSMIRYSKIHKKENLQKITPVLLCSLTLICTNSGRMTFKSHPHWNATLLAPMNFQSLATCAESADYLEMLNMMLTLPRHRWIEALQTNPHGLVQRSSSLNFSTLWCLLVRRLFSYIRSSSTLIIGLFCTWYLGTGKVSCTDSRW